MTAEHAATPRAAAPSELELIDRARREVRSAPASALASAAEHERRFPPGAMAEEREVIRISALAALGKRAEARARGEAFLRVNPDTAYAPRIRSLIGSD